MQHYFKPLITMKNDTRSNYNQSTEVLTELSFIQIQQYVILHGK